MQEKQLTLSIPSRAHPLAIRDWPENEEIG
jgi:hypothetical protein